MTDYETGRVPPHFVIKEEQPYISANDLMSGVGWHAYDVDELPIADDTLTEFDKLVRETRKLLGLPLVAGGSR